MKFISIRDLRLQPSEVWQQLRDEAELVLTSNGRPIAVLIDVEEGDLEATLDALRRARAQRAVSRLRQGASERGRVTLSPEEIEAEIAATRAERRP